MRSSRIKLIATPDRITAFVHSTLHAIRVARGDPAVVDVPAPVLQTPDVEGCNWHMNSLKSAAGYESSIRKALNMARARFNLVD